MILVCLASQYGPGVMEEVIENRQAGRAWASLSTPLPATHGAVAVTDCANLGDILWLRPIDSPSWESFLVADCARPNSVDGTQVWMQANRILAEIDHPTAVRWGVVNEMAYIQPKNIITSRLPILIQ
jgi:hypothetical protein